MWSELGVLNITLRMKFTFILWHPLFPLICQAILYGYYGYSRPSILNSLVLGVVRISLLFFLHLKDAWVVNVYIFNGAYSIFHLMHHKILMNIITYGFRFARVQISEGLLYYQRFWTESQS